MSLAFDCKILLHELRSADDPKQECWEKFYNERWETHQKDHHAQRKTEQQLAILFLLFIPDINASRSAHF